MQRTLPSIFNVKAPFQYQPMISQIYTRLHLQDRYPFLAAIALSAIFSIGLLVGRMVYTHNSHFTFLVWNLFLALLPIAFSFGMDRKFRWKAIPALSFILWLLFFPNSPYILTDLFHLRNQPGIPLWFDLMVILSFAWTGLMAGYYSLFKVLDFFREKRSEWFTQTMAILFLALASYGVYLGRVRRWNSWDILADPQALLSETVVPLLHPTQYFRVYALCAALLGFLIMGYLLLTALMTKSNPMPSAESRKS